MDCSTEWTAFLVHQSQTFRWARTIIEILDVFDVFSTEAGNLGSLLSVYQFASSKQGHRSALLRFAFETVQVLSKSILLSQLSCFTSVCQVYSPVSTNLVEMLQRRIMPMVLIALLSVGIQEIQGATTPEWRLPAGGQIITACTVPKTVGMSFDDGPYIYTQDIVDILKKNNASATFFYNGLNYDCIYNTGPASRVKFAFDNGMHVASHTWSHGDLATMDRAKLHDEMGRLEDALRKITGAIPAFIRPPFGSYSQQVLDVARSRGQLVVNWDLDSEDSMGASAGRSIQLYRDRISQHPSSIMVLNHETYATTVHQVLPVVLPELSAAGYRVVDVATCLGVPKYLKVSSPGQRDSTWRC